MSLTKQPLKTCVYIDGFNLYYGCFKRRPHWRKYKWLNLERFCDSLFPRNDIINIKYFTATVKNFPPDNNQANRQRSYLKALSTLKRLEIIKGHFLGPMKVAMPQCDETGKYLGNTVTVLKVEEKGSDVNLAVHLFDDCIRGRYECAIIISNDSDLLTPIQWVHDDYNKTIGIVNPHPQRPNRPLARIADFRIRINEQALAFSQFPEEIRIGSEIFRRPDSWH